MSLWVFQPSLCRCFKAMSLLKIYLNGASEKSYDSHRSYNFSQGFLVEGRENVYTGRSTLKEARTYDCFSHKRPVIWQTGDGIFFLIKIRFK